MSIILGLTILVITLRLILSCCGLFPMVPGLCFRLS
ncbi:unnamed protein product [Sordaria macrospora k-hell]|uniref:WGS project CABT00000000 data, contig 2.13 n=1 Tax=Sordaria macrospora (strain ATCC MYA-333 / DSM 997 / K(L3346) / K-hell) TaxID=771870 RepID=F7VYA0_SORMK|nr:uncharacterized protein SMAC_12722 [Sordaria macrospora k-hell]CCC10494.1 unnamed protein product [Sordaria macrospora k-hell]